VTSRAREAAMAVVVGIVLFTGSIQISKAQSLDWQTVTAENKTALAYAVGIGEEDHLSLFACRAKAGAGVHPGRFRADFTGCHIGFGGQEISAMPFEVLTPVWQEGGNGVIPPNSFVAGQRASIDSEAHFNLTTLYPCRASYQDGIQVGEIGAGDRHCRFGFAGRQVSELKYQVLWDAPWMTWIAGVVHQIPPDAIAAGTEGGENFYVCRAGNRTGLHPGKIKQSSPGCAYAAEGDEIVATQFSLLVPKWVAGNAGTIPVTALPVGNEKQDLLYLCRAQMRNTVQIGKIAEQLASCHVGMLGGENASPAYDVLSER
jgi:hypothetical protein